MAVSVLHMVLVKLNPALFPKWSNMLKLVCSFGLFTTVTAIFPSDSDVIHLTATTFNKIVAPSNRIWFIMFYSPSCGYCHQFVPEYSRAATGLKGIVRLGVVNAIQEKHLATKFGINSFPTVKIFTMDKNHPEEYHGKRTASDLVDAGISAVQRKVKAQFSGKTEGGRNNNFKDVTKLTNNNFKYTVLDSNDIWMINFYTPSCKSCKMFESVWARAATELKGKVRFGAVDISLNKILAEKYDIKVYPTVKYFQIGPKNKILDYIEDKKFDSIVEFAMKIFIDSKPSPKIRELINYETFNNACVKEQLCVISFLPHLLDCQSKCRRSHLKMLRSIGRHFKEKSWGWLWSEGNVQTDLEGVLGVGGLGYPTMVAIHFNKQWFSVLHGAFSETGITLFLRDLSYGRGNNNKLIVTPNIHEIIPWNRKDATQSIEQYDKDDNKNVNKILVPSEQAPEQNSDLNIGNKNLKREKNEGLCIIENKYGGNEEVDEDKHKPEMCKLEDLNDR